MNATANDLHYRKILSVGLIAFLLTVVLVVAIVMGYGMWLGFEARGQPDEARIQAFGELYGPIFGAALLILFAFLGGRWIAKRVTSRVALHGALVGVVIALLGMGTDVFTGIDLRDVIGAVGIVAAGWLGASTFRRGAAVVP